MLDLWREFMPNLKGFLSSVQFENRSVPRKVKAGWALMGFISFAMLLTTAHALAQTQTDFGKPDAPPNPISGQVLEADAKPAAFAKVFVRGYATYGVDASVPTDENGRFDFVVRIPSNAMPQLQVWAENQDGSQNGFHRFHWDEKERTTKDIQIKLQSLRTINVEVAA